MTLLARVRWPNVMKELLNIKDSMHEELKKFVCDANIELQKRNLVIYSWGNVSGIDRATGIVAIKPSGVSL